MTEVYVYVVVYINDRSMWMYDDLHDWWRYMDMWWLTWVTGIYILWFTRVIKEYGYTMNYSNDKDIWICYDLHEWQEYMDMLLCVWIWYGLHDE